MATNPAPGACLKCGTPHVPGAAFCGSCGTPAGSPGAPPQPAYAPLPPPMPPRFGMAQQGPSAPIMLATDVASAIHAASAAVTATRGTVTWQGPTSLTFTTKLGWGNGSLSGTIEAAPAGPGQTSVTLNLVPQYGIVLGAAGIGAMMWVTSMMNPYSAMPGIAFILIGGVSAAYAYYNITGPGKEKKRRDIVQALQANAPVAAPGMAPPPMAPAAAAPAQATPFEQLRRLAELRDGGAISAADFDAAKARILGGLGR